MAETGGVGDSKGSGSVGEADGPSSVDDDKDVSETEVEDVAEEAMGTGDDVAASVGAAVEAEDPLDTIETDLDPEDVAVEDAASCPAPEHDPDLAAVPAEDAVPSVPRDQEFIDELHGHMKETRGELATCEKAELVHDIVHATPETAPGVEARIVELSKRGEVDGLVLGASLMHSSNSPNASREQRMEQAIRTADFTTPSTPASEFASAIISNGSRGRLPSSMSAPTSRTTPSRTTAPRAPLGDLTPSEVSRIQAAADRLGSDIYVVGSAAKGERRGIGTDLPIGGFGTSKSGTRSDIDYVVRDGVDDRANRLDLPDVDPGFGVRGVDYINLDASPAVRFSPGRPPELLGGGGRLDLN